MADALLDAAVAAETELAQADEMLTVLRESPGIAPADIRAAEGGLATARQSRRAAYAAHAAANADKPLYEADQHGLHRLSPEKIEAHEARWAQAAADKAARQAAETAAQAAADAEFQARVDVAVAVALAKRT